MSLAYVGPGDTIPISGLTTDLSAGDLYNVGDSSSGHGYGWWGIVEDDVIGTSSTLTTVDGRPILDEDLSNAGLSIQGVNVGTGKGDVRVTGVHEMVVASGIAQTGAFDVGVPVYASGTNTRAGASTEAQGSLTVTTKGMVQAEAAYSLNGAAGGLSLVGHVWRSPFFDSRDASPFKGSWVAEVKLLGRPVAGSFA